MSCTVLLCEHKPTGWRLLAIPKSAMDLQFDLGNDASLFPFLLFALQEEM